MNKFIKNAELFLITFFIFIQFLVIAVLLPHQESLEIQNNIYTKVVLFLMLIPIYYYLLVVLDSRFKGLKFRIFVIIIACLTSFIFFASISDKVFSFS